VHYHTLNFDPACLPALPDSSVKAFVIVHMNGAPADILAAQAYCHTHNLFLIEDNAQATGAMYKGKRTGCFGIAAAHSFYPTKPLGALGDGGAITTNDSELATKCRVFANYGRSQGSWEMPKWPGINSRLDELQARFLLRKLPFVEEQIAEREHQAILYREMLSGLGVQFQEFLPNSTSSYHLCTILHPEREQIRAYLAEIGIETRIHYPYAPHQIAAYGYSDSAAPVAARIARETLTLPL
jgi:dTDP-4-amino-4,6-dideoxygalactose transaminase